MRLTLHLNLEAEEDLLDIGQLYTKDEHIITTFDLEEDDEVLIESLSTEELVEFLGIDSENVIYLDIEE